MRTTHIEIHRTLASTARIPFEKMATAALPRGYQLSLVICGDRLARKMNAQYRGKTYSPNVLSFPLSTMEGEIFLNIRKAEREARSLRISVNERIALLLVHGCFHLAGYDHSDTMEALEERVLARFGFAIHGK